jgi:hypothetical protein
MPEKIICGSAEEEVGEGDEAVEVKRELHC